MHGPHHTLPELAAMNDALPAATWCGAVVLWQAELAEGCIGALLPEQLTLWAASPLITCMTSHRLYEAGSADANGDACAVSNLLILLGFLLLHKLNAAPVKAGIESPSLPLLQIEGPTQVARRSDVDMNGPINNVTYLAWTLETVPRDVFHMNELCEVGCCTRAAAVV